MGIVTIESLLGILMVLTAVYLFYSVLDSVSDRSEQSLRIALLEDKASSAQLAASIYSYSIAYGRTDIRLQCPVGPNITCTDESGNSHSVPAYLRRGGGN